MKDEAMASEVIAEALAPEITIITSEEQEWDRIGQELQLQAEPQADNIFSARDDQWFAEAIAVEGILRRQGFGARDSAEISLDELEALLASERNRNY